MANETTVANSAVRDLLETDAKAIMAKCTEKKYACLVFACDGSSATKDALLVQSMSPDDAAIFMANLIEDPMMLQGFADAITLKHNKQVEVKTETKEEVKC